MCVKTRSGSTALQLLEDLLDVAADVREEAVAKLVHAARPTSARRQERGRARPRLVGALARAQRARPTSPSSSRLGAREREDRAAAADLDVVGVTADASTRRNAARRRPQAAAASI